jgi:hypothetical protein
MCGRSKGMNYTKEETQRHIEAALRGARIAGPQRVESDSEAA